MKSYEFFNRFLLWQILARLTDEGPVKTILLVCSVLNLVCWILEAW